MTRQRQSRALTNLSEQVAQRYYTSQEAQKRLGMTRDMFNHHVKQGTIKKHNIVGAHGYYLRKEIDLLAEKIEYRLMTAEDSVLEYRAAMPDDLDALNRMAYFNFGEFSRSPERVAARRRILEANPQSTWVLTNYGNVVASLDLLPLKHEAILEFREGKRGWTFPDGMIEQFEPGHRLECIIIDMMTTTTAHRVKKASYAEILLLHFGNETLKKWGEEGIDIKTIDACGGFDDGRHILNSAGFESIGVKANDREIFHLDIDQSRLRPLQPYKEALATWQASHS